MAPRKKPNTLIPVVSPGVTGDEEYELTPQEEAFAEAMCLMGTSVKEAGAQAGISVATAYKWLEKPGIKAKMRQIRAAIRMRALARIYKRADDIVENFLDTATNPEVTPSMARARKENMDFLLGPASELFKEDRAVESSTIVILSRVPHNSQAREEQERVAQFIEAEWREDEHE
jgi:5'-3' exonuclease